MEPTLFRIYDVIAQTPVPEARTSEADNVSSESDRELKSFPQHEETVVSSNITKVRLHGIIVAIRRAGANRRYFDLIDPTGSIQLSAERDRFAPDEWEALNSLARGERIYVEGHVAGVSRHGQHTITMTGVPESAGHLSGTLSEVGPEYRNIGTRLFIARIRDIIESYLQNLGYLRVETRVISASWNGSVDLNPLRVVYPGFGVPVYLAPSPGPQLVDALIATGEDLVFASTTSFMATYRSMLDGVEAAIIYAKTMRMSVADLIGHAIELLNNVAHELGAQRAFEHLPIREYSWDAESTTLPQSSREEVQIFRRVDPIGEESVMNVFRLLDASGTAPVEGIVEQSAGGMPVGTMSIFPERLLPLVEHLPLRRLGHLSGKEGLDLSLCFRNSSQVSRPHG